MDHVEYARVRDISFTSAMKMKADLDEKIANISDSPFTNSSPQQAATKKIPEPTEAEMEAFYAELSKCHIKPIALSLIPDYADSFVLKSRTIPTIFDNFNRKHLDLSYPELVKVCQEVKIELTREQMAQVEGDTISQAKGNGFFKHRAGRIGASQSKATSHSNPALPSNSLIQSICYPELNKLNTDAIRHGCKHEQDAINAYEKVMNEKHVNFRVVRCGLFINKQYPWLHVSPDFLCSCDCCGKGCGEVKMSLLY